MLPKFGLPVITGVTVVLLVATPGAGAQGTGGAASPKFVSVTSIRCVPSPAIPCRTSRAAVAGGKLRMRGSGLRASRSVVFRGRRGRADDAVARVRHSGPRHAEVPVPVMAQTGPVQVVTDEGLAVTVARRLRVRAAEKLPGDVFFAGDNRRPTLAFEAASAGTVTVEVLSEALGGVIQTLTVDAQPGTNTVTWDGRTADGPVANGRYSLRIAGAASPAAASSTDFFNLFDHVFPIRGRHDLGQSATNNFGGGRGHRGQDMFAACGTPLVAARGGKVRAAGYNGAAGNYAVISSAETGLDYVYMHMRRAPLIKTGDVVSTREPIGEVGDSGNASGCHLHFELWNAPGWYAGGSAFDPLPRLRAWDGWS
jgi:murein DD-endopeptidase MepM/ murein hydrolase activator NlpD